MNWIILVIAGLFEVAFASCLGKAKETTGLEMYGWYVGFLVSLTISMLLLVNVTFLRILFMTTLIGSIIGLKVVSN